MSVTLVSSVIKEPVTGTIDGVNTSFSTSQAYLAGSLRLTIRGVFRDPSDTDWGYSETGSTTFTINTAPLEDDRVTAIYRPD